MDNKMAFARFNAAAQAFNASHIIIVDKALSSFLETLVSTPELFAVVSEAAKTVSYKTEYANAFTRSKNGVSFVLPGNKRHAVALVLGLLYDFDRRVLSISDFVTRYFPAETPLGSFKRFCSEIMEPFAEAFRTLLTEESEEEPAEEVPQILPPFGGTAKEDCDGWLRSLLERAVGDNSLGEDLRDDAVTMIKGLLFALDGGNPTIIKLVFIGLKYTLGARNAYLGELKAIETVLSLYGVLD